MVLLLTIEVNNESAMKTLHSLENKQYIRINDDMDIHSPALPGKPLTLKAFRNWIEEAEQMPTISLKEAKQKWAGKRKKLQQFIK